MDKKIGIIAAIVAVAAIASYAAFTSISDTTMVMDDVMDTAMSEIAGQVTDESPVVSSDTSDPESLTGAVKIGIMLPLTGDLSSHGNENNLGTLYGIEKFNEYLKSIGEDWYLDPVVEDTATNPVQSLEKIQVLRAKNIELVIGPESSGSVSSVLQYADNNGMILFSCCSSSPALAISGDNAFRLVPDDSQQGKALATLLRNEGIDAIIPIWRGDPYGDGLIANAKQSFIDLGGVTDEGVRYNPESPDFSVSTSVLSERVQILIDEHGKDKVAVVIVAFAEALQFVQSAAQHDALDEIRWFGTGSLADEIALVDDPIAVEFSNSVKFTTVAASFTPNEIADEVKQNVFETIGRHPNTFVITSYDISWIYGLAMQQVQSDRSADIKPILKDIANEYSGASGSVILNENDDRGSADYGISSIIDGKWTFTGIHYKNGTIIYS